LSRGLTENQRNPSNLVKYVGEFFDNGPLWFWKASAKHKDTSVTSVRVIYIQRPSAKDAKDLIRTRNTRWVYPCRLHAQLGSLLPGEVPGVQLTLHHCPTSPTITHVHHITQQASPRKMDTSRATLYAFSEQTIVAPFIDNQLVEAHPALAANNNSNYDSSLGCYVQREDGHHAAVEALQPALMNDSNSESTDDILPARPLPDPVSAMKFWDDIFDDAMEEFIDGAEADPNKSAYTIRDKKDWDSLFGQLESARNKFNSTMGVRGKMKKIYRKVADNVQPVIEITKLVPDIEYTTPVLGAVEFLLEVRLMLGPGRSVELTLSRPPRMLLKCEKSCQKPSTISSSTSPWSNFSWRRTRKTNLSERPQSP
jgi:hypothetical protein